MQTRAVPQHAKLIYIISIADARAQNDLGFETLDMRLLYICYSVARLQNCIVFENNIYSLGLLINMCNCFLGCYSYFDVTLKID